jgi:hypothetical protein
MVRSKITSYVVFIAIGGMVAAGPSQAVSLVGTATDASGLNGLVVDGVTYDVTFIHDLYNDVYPPNPNTFLSNPSGAADAAAALKSALNSFSVTILTGLNTGQASQQLSVPYAELGTVYHEAFDISCNTSVPTGCSSPWQSPFSEVEYSIYTYGAIDYASFTQVSGASAATPAPAALPLFAAGLGVMGLLGRRRKRKNAAIAA